MSRIVSYRLVLPKPWVRIPVREGAEERVRVLVAEIATRFPKEAPPDQVGPWTRQIERRLLDGVRSARASGGVDLYLPSDTWHGFLVGASFVVSDIVPPGFAPEELEGDRAVGAVLAELVATTPGARPMTLDDTTWVRSERVAQPETRDGEQVEAASVRVEYSTAVPDDVRRWVLVAFSTVGDGDPASDLTRLQVELFDAIMGTWRWIRAGDPFESTSDEPAPFS